MAAIERFAFPTHSLPPKKSEPKVLPSATSDWLLPPLAYDRSLARDFASATLLKITALGG